MSRDPRDVGSQSEKDWQEFRASYSAALLFTWLLNDSGGQLATYVNDLHERFMMAWDIAAGMELGNGHEVKYIPLPNTVDDITDNVWISDAEAHKLYQQLFPYGHEASADFRSGAHGLAVIALHAALETYAKAAGANLRRTPLPRAVEIS